MKRIFHLFSVFALAFFVTACTNGNETPANTTTPPLENQADAQGRVVMTITDAAADMGAVTAIEVTVDSVWVHSEARGWIEVASPRETYDLLELEANNEHALLAETELDVDQYDQMRLEISRVTVTDDTGEHDARQPSGMLRVNGDLLVTADSTATASFDIIADESLHTTGNGTYIFAPIIQLETRADATAVVAASGRVDLSGGAVRTSQRVGMDTDGNLVVGGRLPPFLSIDSNGRVTGTQSVALPSTGANADIDVNSQIN
jgi:hypothetical protein